MSDFSPEWDFATEAQLGVLVLDGSGSMSGGKAEGVAKAVHGLLQRLYRSSRAPDIHIGIICYDTKNSRETRAFPFPVTDSVSVSQPEEHWNPMIGHGGGTPIGEALQHALEMGEQWLRGEEGELSRSVVIVLLSDGLHNSGTLQPEDIAKRIKSNAKMTLATVAYGTSAAGALQSWASNQDYYTVTDNPDKLRDFFIKSIEASRQNQ